MANDTKTRILLIDDEPLVREELGGILEDEGYEVIRASDGEQGLTLFQTEHPDMVITDVRMPRSDGISVAATIRQLQPTVPITVITGHGSEAMVVDALRAGVTDFLRKPVRIDDLLAALSRMRAAIVWHSGTSAQMPESVVLISRGWTFALTNDLEAIPPFVDCLLQQVGYSVDQRRLSELSLALRELLLNAVEHGNLGLSYREKSAALETGQLSQLQKDRSTAEPYCNRKLAVTVTRDSQQLCATIKDDGDGFNWRTLPDPTDISHLLVDHGRGVLLAQLSVDSLSYNDRGNEVTVTKKLAN